MSTSVLLDECHGDCATAVLSVRLESSNSALLHVSDILLKKEEKERLYGRVCASIHTSSSFLFDNKVNARDSAKCCQQPKHNFKNQFKFHVWKCLLASSGKVQVCLLDNCAHWAKSTFKSARKVLAMGLFVVATWYL